MRGSLPLAPFPAGLEQRQIILLLIGMLLNLFDVEIDAQPGPGGYFEIAIHLVYGMSHDPTLPRLVEFIEQLVYEKVWNRGIELYARRRAYRPLRAMRRDHAEMGAYHVCGRT